MKKCTKCEIEKSEEEFYKRSGKQKHLLSAWCKQCRRSYQKNWRNNNPEYGKKYAKKWRKENPDYDRTLRSNRHLTEKSRKYRIYHYHNIESLNAKIARGLRTRLRISLKNKQKSGSAIKDLGCSIEELKVYLEKQFQEEMTWDNYGDWHIDHIIPLSSFDLEDKEQFLKACHYTNLQPLWAQENLKKGRKVEII